MRVVAGLCVALACASCSTADETATGRSAISTENTLTTNSLVENGVWSNGVWSNGVWSNGVWSNGVWSNGVWSNSVDENGVWSNGVWSNGVWSNGVWSNGVWSNGVWSNGAWQGNTAARELLAGSCGGGATCGQQSTKTACTAESGCTWTSSHTAQVMQYLYSCTMPAGSHKTLDAGGGLTVELDGAIGLWPTWAREGSTCDAGCQAATTHWLSVMPAVSPDSCDETCQRWVSACLLARTNAYGVRVQISMRAPETAPQGIRDALAVTEQEKLDFPLREGAFYGNLFQTTPPPDGVAGPLENTPVFYACAGPGSNIPEITKRFCSSQGNDGPIDVTGRCVQVCDGIDADTDHGAMQSCHTTEVAAPPYDEVISVYIHDLIEVCGNAVCEANELAGATCPSDCHPGAWARTYPGVNLISERTINPPLRNGDRRILAIAADNTILMAGAAQLATELDYGGPLTGTVGPDDHYLVLARYSPSGAFLSGRRYPITANHGTTGSVEIASIAVGAGGSIALSANVKAGGQGRVVILELAPAGDVVWTASSIGDNSTTFPITSPDHNTDHGLAVAPNGDVLVGGRYSHNLRFEGPPASATPETGTQCSNASDDDGDGVANDGCVVALPVLPDDADQGFVVKLSATGLPLWGTQFVGQAFELVRGVAADAAGNAFVTFTLGGTMGLAKLSSTDGALAWSVPGAHEAVIADASGDVYAAGSYDPSGNYAFAIPIDQGDLFVVKYAGADGAPLAAARSRASGGVGFVTSFHVRLDADGNVVVGAFGGNPSEPGVAIDFGAGPFVSYASADIYVSSYSPDLAFRWAKHVPLVLEGANTGLVIDAEGRVVISGTYAGSMVADDNLLVNDTPEDPINGNSFLSSVTPPPPNDVDPPVPGHVPSSFTLEATSADGAPAWYMPPTAIDTGFAGTSVSCVPDASSVFPIGVTTVTCYVRDPLGNTPPLPSTFTITVVDSLAPTFTTFQESVTLEGNELGGARFAFALPSAVDRVDGAVAVSCDHASGSLFAVGATAVSCTASDASNNTSSNVFTVTVTDATPPIVMVPGTTTAGPGGIATFTTTAHDLVDGDLPVTCTPPSGGAFPPGTTTVACTATDAAGNVGTASFIVEAPLDTTPPVLILPDDISVEATDPSGAVVTYVASSIDDVDGPGGAICFLPSGSTFPLGTSTVTCVASDAAGNEATGTFAIRVEDTTPPVVQCPGPLAPVVVAPGGTVPVPDLASSVVATDNHTPPAMLVRLQTPLAGTLVGAGTHAISVRVGDLQGNTFACPDVLFEVTSPIATIAFSSTRDGNAEIYTTTPDGGTVVRLTHHEAADLFPAWSPDRTKLAFASNRASSGVFDLYVMSADGSGVRRVTTNALVAGAPAWSPDGTRLAFAGARAGNLEIYTIGIDGQNLVRLTYGPASDAEPAWSPDGTQLAFTSDRDQSFEIYTMHSNGRGIVRLTYDTATDGAPDWGPNGKIAFASTRAGNVEIYVMTATGGSLMRLTRNLAADGEPTWSPDGSRLAFTSSRSSVLDIYTMAADGSAQVRVTHGLAVNPDW
jgi:hypothetical protein